MHWMQSRALFHQAQITEYKRNYGKSIAQLSEAIEQDTLHIRAASAASSCGMTASQKDKKSLIHTAENHARDSARDTTVVRPSAPRDSLCRARRNTGAR
jgi:hypothetical protein